MTKANEANKNDAKDLVFNALIAQGYKAKRGEKQFDVILRFMHGVDDKTKESIDSAVEQALIADQSTDFDEQDDIQLKIVDLEDQVKIAVEKNIDLEQQLERASEMFEKNKTNSDIAINAHMFELLLESACGFSDGLHYRSYCHRVNSLAEAINQLKENAKKIEDNPS